MKEINKNKKTDLKICGIRSLEEIEELKNLDIDYFGCIFAESPRKVSVELAKKITEIAHKNGKKTVSVFVNEDLEKILKIIENTKIDVVQLHGNESVEYCKELFLKIKEKELNTKLWKVFSIKDKLPNYEEYSQYIEFPLFDTKGEKKGGNGITFDWSILKNIKNYILAGGLSKENIVEALKYNPKILDVNSKVEINNRKNKELIEEIIKILENKK